MKRVGTNIRMTEEIRNKLFNEARKTGRTLSEIVREAVEIWFEQKQKAKGVKNGRSKV